MVISSIVPIIKVDALQSLTTLTLKLALET